MGLVVPSLLADGEAGVGECLRRIHSRMPADFTRCKTYSDSILTELMEEERDAGCQTANFTFLICEHLWNFTGLGLASA